MQIDCLIARPPCRILQFPDRPREDANLGELVGSLRAELAILDRVIRVLENLHRVRTNDCVARNARFNA